MSKKNWKKNRFLALFSGCPVKYPLHLVPSLAQESPLSSSLLASSSNYRRQLLQKLGLAFSCASPDIDEARLAGETPEALVRRLALGKAQALSPRYPEHLIIGSDQAASFEGEVLGKPLTFERAQSQLTRFSGKSVEFLTGLCLYNSRTHEHQLSLETYKVRFKELSARQITRYLEKEQPYDCAGSFKSEGLGICLFDALEGEDPNTLVGLPLIALTRMLIKEGIDPLTTDN